MIVVNECVELERVGRHRREDGSGPFQRFYLKSVAIGSAPDLEPPTAVNKVIVTRIKWEQHAEPAFRVGMQDDQMAILVRLDVDTRVIADRELVVIELYGDRRLNEQQQ